MVDSYQKGFTLIEVLVSLVLLTIGAGTVWYAYQTSAKLSDFNKRHREALAFAQNEIEYLRLFSKDLVNDTDYVVSGSFANKYKVTRIVFDSAKIEETLDEIDVDEKMRPLYLRRPLEIKVEIREIEDEWNLDLDAENKPVVTISMLKPDYQWY